MSFNASATRFSTAVTVKASHYLGARSISGILTVYHGAAATAGNEIDYVPDGGASDPTFPVHTDQSGQIHVTATEGIVYYSPG